MKTTLIFIFLGIAGCGNVGIMSDDMQPDGSYKILAGGNIMADDETLRDETVDRAKRLCPNGYDVKSDIPVEHGRGTTKQLIVKCH